MVFKICFECVKKDQFDTYSLFEAWKDIQRISFLLVLRISDLQGSKKDQSLDLLLLTRVPRFILYPAQMRRNVGRMKTHERKL